MGRGSVLCADMRGRRVLQGGKTDRTIKQPFMKNIFAGVALLFLCAAGNTHVQSLYTGGNAGKITWYNHKGGKSDSKPNLNGANAGTKISFQYRQGVNAGLIICFVR